MSKTSFKCFLVYYEHTFVYSYVFAVTFTCYQFCIESRRSHRGVVYKRCSLKLRNIYRKTPVVGSLFSKVVCLQAINYINRDSNTGVSCQICKNVLKYLFWKTSANGCFSMSHARIGVKVKKITERSSQYEFWKVVVKAKSSHRRCSMKKAFLKNLAIFTEKHLCWSLFLIKFIKKRLQYRCFPMNMA